MSNSGFMGFQEVTVFECRWCLKSQEFSTKTIEDFERARKEFMKKHGAHPVIQYGKAKEIGK